MTINMTISEKLIKSMNYNHYMLAEIKRRTDNY